METAHQSVKEQEQEPDRQKQQARVNEKVWRKSSAAKLSKIVGRIPNCGSEGRPAFQLLSQDTLS